MHEDDGAPTADMIFSGSKGRLVKMAPRGLPKRARLTLAFDKPIARVTPSQNGRGPIVEDEIAQCGPDEQDRTLHTVLIANHRHSQRAGQQTLLDETLAFYEPEVLLVAVAVLGEVPVILDASMLHAGYRLDCCVELLHDFSQQSQPSS